MRNSYNRFAGQSLDRLAALADGIFAVAMTLLVLNLAVETVETDKVLHWLTFDTPNELVLLGKLGTLLPHLLAYFMSFLTLGIFWVAHQTQLDHFTHSTRHLTWIHLSFLLGVSILPFSTGLLASFITYRVALVVYWLNLVLLGAALFGSWRYARNVGLLKEEATAEVTAATERRIIVYQVVYAIAVLFCVFNTYVSIALLILMQLNSALAPRIKWLNRF
jgi:uncharacterized membrane protein